MKLTQHERDAIRMGRYFLSKENRGGTMTRCNIVGIHEHVFRGPHRFKEWEPGT
jgi:hypothetical protein